MQGKQDFNPRPPCGRRRLQHSSLSVQERFQPTSPVRETTFGECSLAREFTFQPTSPVRETTVNLFVCNGLDLISTHVPRAGDDEDQSPPSDKGPLFQPTSPVRETTRLGS